MRTKLSSDRRLIDLLFSRYHRRILAVLLLHPDESFHVRQIGRLAAVPPGSLHRELSALAAAGLLTRRRDGNQVRYQADRSCPVFEELASLLRKTAGIADVLRDALAPLSASIERAFVYGSVASGKDRATSDVDVMVIGDVDLGQVVDALAPAAERLRREINPVAISAEAFRTKQAAGDRFVTRILSEPKILLLGDEREPREPAEDRADQGPSDRPGC
jgi:predicted nucleotidyltransferase